MSEKEKESLREKRGNIEWKISEGFRKEEKNFMKKKEARKSEVSR